MTRRFAILFSLLSLVSAIQAAEPPRWGFPDREAVPKLTIAAATSSEPNWGTVFVKAPEFHALNPAKHKGRGIKVAIVDNGGQPDHPALGGMAKSTYNAITKRTEIDPGSHGTPVAHAVHEIAPEAELHFVQVMSGNSGSVVDIAAGIEYAVDVIKADLVCLSLGGPTADQWTGAALAKAKAAGTVCVAAAGNEGPGPNTDGWPARDSRCISVAACTKPVPPSPSMVANFSSRGASVWTIDPGAEMLLAVPGNRQGIFQGTSFSAPTCVGKLACLFSANPQVPRAQRDAFAREQLRLGGTRTERTDASGFGPVEMTKFRTGSVQPPPPPPPTPKTITFSFSDLTPEARTRLAAAGVEGVSFTLTLKTPEPRTSEARTTTTLTPGAPPVGFRWTKPGFPTDPGEWTLEPEPSLTPPTLPSTATKSNWTISQSWNLGSNRTSGVRRTRLRKFNPPPIARFGGPIPQEPSCRRNHHHPPNPVADDQNPRPHFQAESTCGLSKTSWIG
jgi:subtilisin family serine protease